MPKSKFSIDADVLIQSHRERLPLDVAPGFWDGLEEAGRAGDIIIIRSVFKEIIAGGDDLSEWLKERESVLVAEDRDDETQDKYSDLTTAVMNRQPPYRQYAIADFFEKADSWLIAQAAAHGNIVVTQEASAPDGRKQVKIPDACSLLSVSCINTIQLIRTLDIKLVRG